MFSNHDGYIFHDSRGLEAGSDEELGIVQRFIRERCRERKLQSRLHAIWFVPVFTISTQAADGHNLEVLRPNGQPATRTGSQIFPRYLPRREW